MLANESQLPPQRAARGLHFGPFQALNRSTIQQFASMAALHLPKYCGTIGLPPATALFKCSMPRALLILRLAAPPALAEALLRSRGAAQGWA